MLGDFLHVAWGIPRTYGDVTPHARNIARSLFREPKLYFFDTGMVRGDDGARLENLVALSLYKHVLGRRDVRGEDASLHYLRTKDGLEVDFCLVRGNEPEVMIEVKNADSRLHRPLNTFQRKTGIPGLQLVRHLRQEEVRGGLQLRRVEPFLADLPFA